PRSLSSSELSTFKSYKSDKNDDSLSKLNGDLFSVDISDDESISSSGSTVSSEEIDFQHPLSSSSLSVTKNNLFDDTKNNEIDLFNQNSKSHFYLNNDDHYEWNIHHFINDDDHHHHNPASIRSTRYIFSDNHPNITWPVKKVAEVHGNITLGGLMMVHEREDQKICGPIMPQGGIQALEAMLHTIDYVNSNPNILPGITLGAYILDDCDKDTYGLEQSIDFIKGK
ncbi:glutamate receptor, metabotropic-like protein, partial [Euroglyphus maynei]